MQTFPSDIPFSSFALYLSTSTGRARYGLCFLFGALATLALPPLSYFPMLLLCFPGFYWLLNGARKKREAFFTGLAFGTGYFGFALYWISAALFVDIKSWWWVLPLSAVGLPLIFGLYYGLAALAAKLTRSNGISKILFFAAFLSTAEWLRGTLFTGFPWGLIGYTWAGFPVPMQINSVIGIYGLTLLTILLSLTPAIALSESPRRQKITVCLALAFLFFGGCIFGSIRLDHAQTGYQDNMRLRIVQPNIKQTLKWDVNVQRANFHKLVNLSKMASVGAPITHIIWPETALTSDIKQNPGLLDILKKSIPRKILLTGNLRVTQSDDGTQNFYHNSLIAIDTSAKDMLGAFDKFHLVPFGEYIPFRDVIGLTSLGASVSGITDFKAGTGPATARIPSTPPFSPLICYEVIFPGKVSDDKNRPQWLLNVTNDAWYGQTSGPHQHLAIAQVRAVEEGIPLVRAANTGISAIIDPYGKIMKLKALATEGVIDSFLPKPTPPTFYLKYRNALFGILTFLVISIAFIIQPKKISF